MGFERSIKVAFDKVSGEILEADEIFDGAKNAFEVRKKAHKDEVKLYCCECEQKLNVSTSKYDRLHFKHLPKARPCLLKDGKFSPEETEQITRIFKSKESERHKFLKNEIARKLSVINGINSISVDDKFISDGDEKRKPDVYCQYFDKELVFEIQLSDLSLRYIINRYEFYKRKNIYLIWILDKFDVKGQSQTERDIKYLTEFQNFFKLDEKEEEFRLICTYKYPFITDSNKLLTKWVDKSIGLNQIKFSPTYCQIYYFNFSQQKELKEKEQIANEVKIREEERRQEERKRLEDANWKANSIFEQLREIWSGISHNCDKIRSEIEDFNPFELEILNQSPAFESKNGQPRIHYWFSIARQLEHYHFLDFMLDCEYFEFDVNEKTASGKNLINTLFENQFLDFKLLLVKKLLARGYKFQVEDEPLLKQLNLSEKDYQSTIILCHLANQLRDKNLIAKLFEHRTLICTIESAKRDEIVGFGWKQNEWIAFANNAIHSYKEYWDYIEIAFRHYGIWGKLISLDRKGTFQKKLMNYYTALPKQNYDCDRLFMELYPELVH